MKAIEVVEEVMDVVDDVVEDVGEVFRVSIIFADPIPSTVDVVSVDVDVENRCDEKLKLSSPILFLVPRRDKVIPGFTPGITYPSSQNTE